MNTNDCLSQKAFTTLVCTFLSPVVRRYNKMSGRDRLCRVLEDVQRYARWNEEDGIGSTYGLTAYAVAWSVETLRLNQEVETTLHALNVRGIVVLLATLHEKCATQIEVTHYLNATLSRKAS